MYSSLSLSPVTSRRAIFRRTFNFQCRTPKEPKEPPPPPRYVLSLYRSHLYVSVVAAGATPSWEEWKLRFCIYYIHPLRSEVNGWLPHVRRRLHSCRSIYTSVYASLCLLTYLPSARSSIYRAKIVSSSKKSWEPNSFEGSSSVARTNFARRVFPRNVVRSQANLRENCLSANIYIYYILVAEIRNFFYLFLMVQCPWNFRARIIIPARITFSHARIRHS